MEFWQSLQMVEVDQLKQVAMHAELLGFSGITLGDHLVFPPKIESPYPYTEDNKPYWKPTTPFPDPWANAAVLATVTERVRFMPSVYIVSLRDPITAAKSIATSAVFTGNRVVLGIGVGWMAEEFAMLGQDFSTRGKRTDEALEIIRLFLAGDVVEYHGAFYDIPAAQMAPTPSQPVPVYIGGSSDAALRRAARNDGWIATTSKDAVDILPLLDRLERFREEVGRADAPFEVIVSLTNPGPEDVQILEERGVAGFSNPLFPVSLGLLESPLSVKLAAMEKFAEQYIHVRSSG